MKNRLAILGSGPSACYAAWAAREREVDVPVDIFSCSGLGFGLSAAHFYLHAIPARLEQVCDIPAESQRMLQIHYVGGLEGFVIKQWGKKLWESGWRPSSEFGRNEMIQVWSARMILQRMWSILLSDAGVKIIPTTPLTSMHIKEIKDNYRWVLQGFPSAQAMRVQPEIVKYLIWQHKALALEHQQYSMMYDGLLAHDWTRMTIGEGTICIEYTIAASNKMLADEPNLLKDPEWSLMPILPPRTKSWTEEDGIQFIGRFARWDHSRVHHAYWIAHRMIMGQEPASNSLTPVCDGPSSAGLEEV